MNSLISIDGSHGEGGGQIIRTALSLSCLLKHPITIENIRKGRKKPGLQPQHLTSVKAAGKISHAKVEGASLGSEQLSFVPSTLKGGEYNLNVAERKGSAGSTGLVFQTIAPILLFAEGTSRIRIKGGTHTAWSPTYHYVNEIFLSNLSLLNRSVNTSLMRWGFYPLGGGEIEVEIFPLKKLLGKEWIRGDDIKEIKGISAVANLSRSIAERQRKRALDRLRETGLKGEIEIVEADTTGKGTFLFLRIEYENLSCGFSALGERGKSAEKVADEAFDAFYKHHQSECSLDPHMADQILLYAALAEGKTQFSTSKITNHLLTNLWVLRKFLPLNIDITGIPGEHGSITIEGIGFNSDNS
jgi:RNA 3'-phosphate cyclase